MNQGVACHDRNVKQTAANGPLSQGEAGALARDEPLHGIRGSTLNHPHSDSVFAIQRAILCQNYHRLNNRGGFPDIAQVATTIRISSQAQPCEFPSMSQSNAFTDNKPSPKAGELGLPSSRPPGKYERPSQ